MPFTTVAAVIREVDAPFRLEEVELDDPRPNEVRLRMVATGLCHTDLSVRSGVIPFPLPGVVGHEGAGVVETVGSGVTRVSPGDRVLASFTSCGRCVGCRGGHPAYCLDYGALNLVGGTRSDGSHTVHQNSLPLNAHFFGQSSLARHALVDERSLVKVDPATKLEILAPLSCGVETGAGTVLNVLRPTPGSTLAIFGAGAVGLSAVMAARLSGVERIIAIDVVSTRLQLAQELGATDVFDASKGSVVEAVMDLTGGRGVDYAVESSGNTSALSDAISGLAPLGTCAVIGAPKAGSTVAVDVNFMLSGRRLVGVSQGDSEPQRFIPALVSLYEQGRLPVDRIVTHYPFERIEDAASDARSGKAVKPVLIFENAGD